MSKQMYKTLWDGWINNRLDPAKKESVIWKINRRNYPGCSTEREKN